MSLALEILSNPGICSGLYKIMIDLMNTIGLGVYGLVFFYGLLVFVFTLAVSGASNELYGALSGFAMYFLIIIIGEMGCIPLPIEFYVLGNFAYILAVIIFYRMIKKGESAFSFF